MCASWRFKQDETRASTPTSAAEAPRTLNCATFAAEFFEMIAEPEERRVARDEPRDKPCQATPAPAPRADAAFAVPAAPLSASSRAAPAAAPLADLRRARRRALADAGGCGSALASAASRRRAPTTRCRRRAARTWRARRSPATTARSNARSRASSAVRARRAPAVSARARVADQRANAEQLPLAPPACIRRRAAPALERSRTMSGCGAELLEAQPRRAQRRIVRRSGVAAVAPRRTADAVSAWRAARTRPRRCAARRTRLALHAAARGTVGGGCLNMIAGECVALRALAVGDSTRLSMSSSVASLGRCNAAGRCIDCWAPPRLARPVERRAQQRVRAPLAVRRGGSESPARRDLVGRYRDRRKMRLATLLLALLAPRTIALRLGGVLSTRVAPRSVGQACAPQRARPAAEPACSRYGESAASRWGRQRRGTTSAAEMANGCLFQTTGICMVYRSDKPKLWDRPDTKASMAKLQKRAADLGAKASAP